MKIYTSQFLQIGLCATLFVFATSADSFAQRRCSRRVRGFVPSMDGVAAGGAERLETRETPSFIVPGSGGGVEFGIGSAGYGEYINGFPVGGGGSEQSAPSYIHKFTTSLIKDEGIKTSGAEKSVETGGGVIRTQLNAQLVKQKVHLNEGQITQVSVHAALEVFEGESTHFSSKLLHVTQVEVEHVNSNHINVSLLVTQSAQTIKQKGHAPLEILPQTYEVSAFVTLTKNNPDVNVNVERIY